MQFDGFKKANSRFYKRILYHHSLYFSKGAMASNFAMAFFAENLY